MCTYTKDNGDCSIKSGQIKLFDKDFIFFHDDQDQTNYDIGLYFDLSHWKLSIRPMIHGDGIKIYHKDASTEQMIIHRYKVVRNDQEKYVVELKTNGMITSLTDPGDMPTPRNNQRGGSYKHKNKKQDINHLVRLHKQMI
jgi:hypothetical protein